jgi:hypothetical protein
MYHLLRHLKTLHYAHVIFYVSLWFLKFRFFPPSLHNSPLWARASTLPRLHDHTETHHTRQDSSGRVISPSQRLLPDHTQQSQETYIYATGRIRICNPSKRAAAVLRGNWDRLILTIPSYYFCVQPPSNGLIMEQDVLSVRY